MVFPGTRFPRTFDLWWSTVGRKLYIDHDYFTTCQIRYIVQSASPEGFAECILSRVDSFSQVGLSAATSMLTIIPAGLALIPSQGLGVEEAWDLGLVYFLLSAFAGHVGPGASAKSLARNIRESRIGTDLYKTYEPKESLLQGWPRATLLTVGVIITAATIVTATLLGLQTVLTWQADVWWYPLLWVLLRICPALIELLLLRLVRFFLRNKIAAPCGYSHAFWSLAISVHVLCVLGNGLVVIFGTGVLGSLTLIDGATAMKYLFGMPALYATLQLLLRAGCA